MPRIKYNIYLIIENFDGVFGRPTVDPPQGDSIRRDEHGKALYDFGFLVIPEPFLEVSRYYPAYRFDAAYDKGRLWPIETHEIYNNGRPISMSCHALVYLGETADPKWAYKLLDDLTTVDEVRDLHEYARCAGEPWAIRILNEFLHRGLIRDSDPAEVINGSIILNTGILFLRSNPPSSGTITCDVDGRPRCNPDWLDTNAHHQKVPKIK
ncbi:hypothetical protein CC1G_09167 [Coprinopsis cinerea okayama7|uniref:Uncharacterized protein n=1 Tax=Coprinopsis cinerea (strain Okayama-7 / 130 / ATCC MYA-4618 / FGSC 9003) TaxID=240176 RepID=A8P9T3_COPC7|nr:hypothetical protein CC1G_09167 [Coprinopsis cinerea okayama7\|eukprot:XP_001839833.1 hypothetical protein CC1G_09167 [Coprinopsis cinerea okayama7\